MMNVERILETKLDGYEIAEMITIQEMKDILNAIDSKLSNILTVYNSKWFPSKRNTLMSIVQAISVHEPTRDILINKYKDSHPSEVNRFLLEITELEYIYAMSIINKLELEEAILQHFESSGYKLFIKNGKTREEMLKERKERLKLYKQQEEENNK